MFLTKFLPIMSGTNWEKQIFILRWKNIAKTYALGKIHW